jgi:hypothetical protein
MNPKLIYKALEESGLSRWRCTCGSVMVNPALNWYYSDDIRHGSGSAYNRALYQIQKHLGTKKHQKSKFIAIPIRSELDFTDSDSE